MQNQIYNSNILHQHQQHYPQQQQQQQHPHALLYASQDRSVVLVDIPASIEKSSPVRLLSVVPLATPHILPEPKNPNVVFNQELLDIHNKLRDTVVSALEKIRKEHAAEWCLERKIAATDAQDPIFPLMAHDFKINLGLLQSSSEDPLDIVDYDTNTHFDITDIYQTTVCNPSHQYHNLKIAVTGHTTLDFIIPPRSSFLLAPVQSSINTFNNYVSRVGSFNFVLLDPPWPNRSAERCKAAYDTLHNHKDLLLLPLESALRDNGLIGVWVTNKPKWRHFVIQRLFPKWGVEYAGEWIWLKVTKTGEPIFNLESVMRKPYEVLLFGRRPPSKRQLTMNHKWRRGNGGERYSSPNIEAQSEEPCGSPPQSGVNLMPQKVIVAVPDLHSRKPCLNGMYFMFCVPLFHYMLTGAFFQRLNTAFHAHQLHRL